MSPIELTPRENEINIKIVKSPDENRQGEYIVKPEETFIVEDGESGNVARMCEGGVIDFGHAENSVWVGKEGNRYTVEDSEDSEGLAARKRAKKLKGGVPIGDAIVKIYL